VSATIAEERSELEQYEQLVEQWSRKLLDALSKAPPPPDYLDRWRHTASQLSEAIDRSAPPSLDPEQLAEIRGELLRILQRVTDEDPQRPLDSVETALLGLEARMLVHELQETLPRVGRRELAELLGTSERSLQRTLASPTPVEPSRRLEIVARLVTLLRRGWTPEGVIAWLHRPRPELGEQSVLGALDEAGLEQAIFGLARHGRAQHGS
jgi:hypothetical protein